MLTCSKYQMPLVSVHALVSLHICNSSQHSCLGVHGNPHSHTPCVRLLLCSFVETETKAGRKA
jgi:hypothetical protein